jgi:hypothetical protein
VEQVLPNRGEILHQTEMTQAMKSAPNEAVAACYTSAQGSKYFGWADATEDSPAQLADKVVERFPLDGNLARYGVPSFMRPAFVRCRTIGTLGPVDSSSEKSERSLVSWNPVKENRQIVDCDL